MTNVRGALGDRLIHIGAPKCGSTSLQSSFYRNRDAMRTEGVVYVSRGAHWISAAKAAVGAPDRISGKVPSTSEWHKLVAEVDAASGASSNGVRALISSEWFAGASDERVRLIVSELDARRLHAVLVIRPLTSTLPSAWQQGLKLGGRQQLSEWLETILHHIDDPRSQRVWSKHRYDLIARRWANVLGPEKLAVIVANEEDPSFIFSAFGSLLGLHGGTLSAPPKRTNPSLSAFEADTLAELNHIYFERGGTIRDYRAGVFRTFDGYVNSLRSGVVERTVIPAEHIAAVKKLNSEIAAGIRAIGCQVIGDLDRFASAGTTAGSQGTETLPQTDPTAISQRDTDVRSAAGMIYALMVTTGVASPATVLPGFGGRVTLMRHQSASLIRRFARLAFGLIKRRLR